MGIILSCYCRKLWTLGRKKFSVLGFSDGGTTGLILAAQYPEHIRKLVVWGANTYVNEKDIEIQRGMEDIGHWTASARSRYSQLYEDGYLRAHCSKWVKASRNCLAHSKFMFTDSQSDICKAELENITCPTFILHGMKDPLTTTEHPVYLSKHIKNSRLHIIPEGNHHIHMFRADEFNKMVEEFLLECGWTDLIKFT
ncbi:valacyclovir hydrolase-like [Haliotis asinina]|uniref:valacyclovir hydrolase-like n=1 Tax=Haliotis asinina TaxID=109174 RepID=UPI0035320544